MEVWLEHFAEKLAWKIVSSPFASESYPKFCPDSPEYEQVWYEEAVKHLISYKGTWSGMFKNLYGEIFQLGNFRLNVYYNNEGWMDCRYHHIEHQKFEFDNIVEAVYQTFLQRLREMWARQELKGVHVTVANWFYTQLLANGLTNQDIMKFTDFKIFP